MVLDMKSKNNSSSEESTPAPATAKRRRIVAPKSAAAKKPDVKRGALPLAMPTPPPSSLVITHGNTSGKQYSVIEDITPELADIFMTGNVLNRERSPARISGFARDMKAGKWKLTHQGIAVDSESRLLDGQHRLLAIIQSGCTVKMMVSYNVPPEAIHQIDVGLRPRSIADTAKMIRGTPRSAQAVAGVKVIAALMDGYEEKRIWNASEVFEKSTSSSSICALRSSPRHGKLRQSAIRGLRVRAAVRPRAHRGVGKIVASRINMSPTMAAFERAVDKLTPSNTTWRSRRSR